MKIEVIGGNNWLQYERKYKRCLKYSLIKKIILIATWRKYNIFENINCLK